MTVYQWDYEVVYRGPSALELVRAGAVFTRKPSRDTARRAVHRKIHVRDFFELRINRKYREVRL